MSKGGRMLGDIPDWVIGMAVVLILGVMLGLLASEILASRRRKRDRS